MTNYINTLCLLLCILLSSSGQVICQHHKSDITYAHQLCDNGNTKAALKEYLKVYFYDRDNSNPQVVAHISDAFADLNELDNALRYNRIYLKQIANDKKAEANAKYKRIQLLLKAQKTKSALSQLYTMDNDIIVSDPDRYYYYLGTILLQDKKLEPSMTAFKQLTYYSTADTTALLSLLDNLKKNNNKNHKTARLLSTIVPGTGQAVNGEVQDGINSALINGSMIALFFYVKSNLTLIDAIVSVAPWFGRFYIGGMGNALEASKRKQLSKDKELRNEVNRLLRNAKSAYEK